MEESNYYDEYEIDLVEYIMILWNHKLFIGIFVILAVIASFLISSFILSPSYETEAKIKLSNYAGLYSNPDTAVQFLKSTELMGNVIDNLDMEMSAEKLNHYINNNLTVDQGEDSSIISMSVRTNEPKLALNITKSLIENFKNNSNQYFQTKIENEKRYILNLKDDLKNINSDFESTKQLIEENRNSGNLESISLLIQENSSLQNSKRNIRKEIETRESNLLDYYPLEVIDKPYFPENQVSPNVKLNIAISIVLALMLAVFIIFFKEFIKNADLSKYKNE